MALGQVIFAELPGAGLGQPPYIERGRIKYCANQNERDKQDTAQTNWTVAARNATDWDQQDRNNVNTIGCGCVPSNLGGNK